MGAQRRKQRAVGRVVPDEGDGRSGRRGEQLIERLPYALAQRVPWLYARRGVDATEALLDFRTAAAGPGAVIPVIQRIHHFDLQPSGCAV